MEGESKSSSLLCEESETSFVTDDDEVAQCSYGDYSDKDDEYVEMLLKKEISVGFKRDRFMDFDDWVKSARLEALTWILKIRAIFGFQFRTAYLSMTYFDQFLSRKSIDKERSWAIKLLSVACISLAAKMEEIEVPALSEYELEDYNFVSRDIKRMELLVLNTLDWKMSSTTPFVFLHYFITRFSAESPPQDILSRTVGFITAVIKESSLVNYRPAIVAAAATLMALDQNLTRKALEGKLNSTACSGFLELEDVFQYYNQMQKSERENLKTPKSVNSQPDLPRQFRPMEALENHPSVSSTLRNKRKRLTFNKSDQNNTLPDDKTLRSTNFSGKD